MKITHTIKTKLTNYQAWYFFEQAFKESERSRIWPSQKERMTTKAVYPGETLLASYKFPEKKTVTYEFTKVKRPDGFAYKTKEGHPLKGTISINFIKEEDGSTIIWEGNFKEEKRTALTKNFKKFYESLAKDLEKRIRKIEPEE